MISSYRNVDNPSKVRQQVKVDVSHISVSNGEVRQGLAVYTVCHFLSNFKIKNPVTCFISFMYLVVPVLLSTPIKFLT